MYTYNIQYIHTYISKSDICVHICLCIGAVDTAKPPTVTGPSSQSSGIRAEGVLFVSWP